MGSAVGALRANFAPFKWEESQWRVREGQRTSRRQREQQREEQRGESDRMDRRGLRKFSLARLSVSLVSLSFQQQLSNTLHVIP